MRSGEEGLVGSGEDVLLIRCAAGQTVVGVAMATPNYSFEKRKREQAQKAAKEARRQRKAAAKAAAAAGLTPPVADEPGDEPATPEAESTD